MVLLLGWKALMIGGHQKKLPFPDGCPKGFLVGRLLQRGMDFPGGVVGEELLRRKEQIRQSRKSRKAFFAGCF
jgi:hypothetical protein